MRRNARAQLLRMYVCVSILSIFVTAGFAQQDRRRDHNDSRWIPPANLRAQFQLQGVADHCSTGGYNTRVRGKAVDGSWVSPDAYFIDLYADNGVCPQYAEGTPNRDAVRSLHAAGKKAICYVDIGSAEPYRPDYQEFVNFDQQCKGCLLGKPYDSGDPFLNLNNNKGQRSFAFAEMNKRLDKCAEAGFDGVYFDVTWEWQVGKETTGWNISYETQLLYNISLLNLAHMHNLAAGINYDLLQIPDLVAAEDFHIDESCFDYSECDYLNPVTQAGKPVLQIEYFADPATVCQQQPKPYNFNTEFKNQDLFDYPWTTCR
jgi:hypothetical protein